MSENTRQTSLRKTKKEGSKNKRTNHLLIIGIDEYSNGIPALNNAVRDAENFKDLLLEKYQFNKKQVTTLFNEEATRGKIISTFSNLLNKLTEKDNLIFYYSGHGEIVQSGRRKRGFWIPFDAVLHDVSTYLSNNAITQLFSDSYAHHIFGIVDSCFSGSLFRSRALSGVEERLESAPSRWLLTAGRIEPVSDGSLGENSPFATSLLTHLRTNTDSTLWTSELCNRVLRGVSYNTDQQTPRGEPLQNVGNEGGQFVFYKKGFTPKESAQTSEAKSKETTKRTLETKKSPTPITPPPMAKEPTTLSELKLYLKKQVATDLGKALDIFNEYLHPDSSKVNDLILQSASYNSNKESEKRGLITNEQVRRTNARIRYAVLDYIDELETEDVIFKKNTPKKIEYKNANGEQILLDLEQLEQSGLKGQAELLIEKIKRIREALIVEDDPTRQFKYEKQIEQAEKQLKAIKNQM